jgi:glycosyltransferase involved in cell wall biosynthesis
VDDVRWFASNPYTALPVPALRRRGFRIATEGEAPARLALALSGLTAGAAWRFAQRSGARLVVYLWDLPPVGTGRGRPDPVWWLAGRFVRLPRPWGGYRRRRGYYSRLRYVAARADAVWVPSTLTRDTVAQRFGVEALRVPFCYDSDRFVPREPLPSSARPGPPVLLTVSRLRPHKNQAAVLRAAARLPERVHVRLIGRGTEAATLTRLAAELDVSCSVEMTADDETVTRAYREAAVAVCPSRFEGFGLTPLEAVASGVPVVASDIPPHREFVGRAAQLVPLDDAAQLAEAITRAFAAPPPDPELIADLTIAAAADRFASLLPPILN